MDYKRIKNGIKITVAQWASEIVLTEIATGEVIAVKKFNDHIQAVTLAKAL